MSHYENLVQYRVNEALQEGAESQLAFRSRGARKSRIKGLLQLVKRGVSKLNEARNQKRDTPLARAAKQSEA